MTIPRRPAGEQRQEDLSVKALPRTTHLELSYRGLLPRPTPLSGPVIWIQVSGSPKF